MATSDVTIAQDGGQGNIKLHPYLVTLVRWCVSCLWSTATVLLHRLMTAPLQPITGPKPQFTKAKLAKRVAGTEHLHPEPKVDCQLLHQPKLHTHDVIFVHGLYGSLGNTWRQGDWRPKYRNEPKKVILRNHSTKKQCSCNSNIKTGTDNRTGMENDIRIYNITFNERGYKQELLHNNDLITEKFYNNTFIDQIEIIDNYETQANFVRDLFKKECNDCENSTTFYNSDDYYSDNGYKSDSNNSYFGNDKNNSENINSNYFNNDSNNFYNGDKYDINNSCNNDLSNRDDKYNSYYNNDNVNNSCSSSNDMCNSCICGDEKKCEVGCGCNCDSCYSTCWPRDWIKEDYPGARVISVNYTSDPYLWRPLWINENKRLSLHERAEQMMSQLLSMGVGEKPIIWVGHSKGGLFIKQIYCEAYEAYKKLHNIQANENEQKLNESRTNSMNEHVKNTINDSEPAINNYITNDGTDTNNMIVKSNSDINTKTVNVINATQQFDKVVETVIFDNSCNISIEYECLKHEKKRTNDNEDKITNALSNEAYLKARSSLWTQSKGFMFYSVPHRGSPLADIKTPVTARSVELLEISKDCPLVLDLQSRWLSATSVSRPPVHSFVETCRTLMSVLWLRIVSVDSADAGIGTLFGVSVDHREICKPSSRKCILYTELTDLMREALSECKC